MNIQVSLSAVQQRERNNGKPGRSWNRARTLASGVWNHRAATTFISPSWQNIYTYNRKKNRINDRLKPIHLGKNWE